MGIKIKFNFKLSSGPWEEIAEKVDRGVDGMTTW